MPNTQDSPNTTIVPPVADAANGVATTTNSLEAELSNAVSQLQQQPLTFPTPPKAETTGNDFANITSSISTSPNVNLPPLPSSGSNDVGTNAVDLFQTQIGTDPFAPSVTPEVIENIEENPTLQSDATKKSGSDSMKIGIAALAIIVLGGIAFMTVSILSNRGTEAVAPNVPQSQPRAADVSAGEAEATPLPKVQKAICGNGTVEAGEACDDGNIQNGDGCSSGCAISN